MTLSVSRVKRGVRSISSAYVRRLNFQKGGRVFVVSSQRTGTTSTGKFLAELGYPTANWGCTVRNDWVEKSVAGDFGAIFRSRDFKSHQAFEDNPWFRPEMYRVLFHAFPDSRFILLERGADKWFSSMCTLADGRTLGNTRHHCELYGREAEYFEVLDEEGEVAEDNGLRLDHMKAYYENRYLLNNRRIKEFFKRYGPERLFTGHLEDDQKWDKIAGFLRSNP